MTNAEHRLNPIYCPAAAIPFGSFGEPVRSRACPTVLDNAFAEGHIRPVVRQFAGNKRAPSLAFAQWLTQTKSSSLPARVAVNQLWLRHFGPRHLSTKRFELRALRLPLPFPPGTAGTGSPTEFVEKGWSMKSVHRLNCHFRKLIDRPPSSTRRLCPRTLENELLSRMPLQRMDAETRSTIRCSQ